MSQILTRSEHRPIIEASVETRASFITRTYLTLATAIAGFVALEIWFFQSGIAEKVLNVVARTHWGLILGGFMIVGWLATRVASTAQSLAAQYLALTAYVVLEALIFVPLLFIANRVAPGTIQSAALVTLGGFAGLTMVAFVTRKDFSFLRGFILFGGIAALVAVVAGLIFGFNLGLWFSVAMVVLAGASVLYDTSNVLHHYPLGRHVGAALQLFASVALMFWYVLRIFMSQRD